MKALILASGLDPVYPRKHLKTRHMTGDILWELFTDRPWGPDENPKTAVHKYLHDDTEF